MSDLPHHTFDLVQSACDDGLLGWARAMDAQGNVPFCEMLQGRLRVPKGKVAERAFRQSLNVDMPISFVKLALYNPVVRERLGLTLDPAPMRTIPEWKAVVVTGQVCLAALLGLPAVDPVQEVRQLMATLITWNRYWGEAGHQGPVAHLNLYKGSERPSFAWVRPGDGDKSDLVALNASFARDVAADPLISGWLDTLQRGLANKRMGPHSWATFSGYELHGRAWSGWLYTNQADRVTRARPR